MRKVKEKRTEMCCDRKRDELLRGAKPSPTHQQSKEIKTNSEKFTGEEQLKHLKIKRLV